MMINGVYVCTKCNSTITEMTQEVIQFHEAHCEEWSKPLGAIKSVVQSETGELWATVTLNEYMNFERDPDYVPPKITKFKRWRTQTAEKFWYKLHRMADDHGACDARCC